MGCEFVPEQTTAAIILHYPDAKYFALTGTGTGAADRPAASPNGPRDPARTEIVQSEALVGAVD